MEEDITNVVVLFDTLWVLVIKSLSALARAQTVRSDFHATIWLQSATSRRPHTFRCFEGTE